MCAKRKRQTKQLLFSDEFYSDMETDGVLHAKLLRSPYPNGIIADIALPPLPDGYAFFSAKDIPCKKSVKTLGVETPVFYTGRIAYAGEPVGILVGSDEQELERLAARCKILIQQDVTDATTDEAAPTMTPTDTVVTVAEASDTALATQTTASADIQAERVVRYGFANDAEFEANLAAADHLVDGAWSSALRSVSYGEPCGAIASVKGGFLHVVAPTQWVSHLRKALADVTGYDAAKIILTRTPTSDLSADATWRVSVIAAAVAVAACSLGKPVRLVLSREEQEEQLNRAAPVSVVYRTALAKTGELTAIDCTIDIDVGSINPLARELVNRTAIACLSVYRARMVRIRAIARSSRRQPAAIPLSTIDAQAFFAAESQLQLIAERTGLTPLELRLKNWREAPIRHDSFPFRHYCEKAGETLEAVCRASDFERKYTAYRLEEGGRHWHDGRGAPFTPPLRGIALTCAFQGNGFLGTTFPNKRLSMEATLGKDGTLSIRALPPDGATWSVWKKIASEMLELDEAKIVLDARFDPDDEPELPETLNGTIGLLTSLLAKCCRALKAKKNGALPVTVKKGLTPTVRKSWSRDDFCGTPFFSTAFAAAVLELELDANTYREQLRGIWIVANGGKIVNVRAAEGAIRLAVQQVLATLVEDDPVMCHNIRIQFMQSDSDPAPLGGLVQSLLPAAFAAALSQALAARIASLPIQTDTVFVITDHAPAKHSEDAASAENAAATIAAAATVDSNAPVAAVAALADSAVATEAAASVDHATIADDAAEAKTVALAARGNAVKTDDATTDGTAPDAAIAAATSAVAAEAAASVDNATIADDAAETKTAALAARGNAVKTDDATIDGTAPDAAIAAAASAVAIENAATADAVTVTDDAAEAKTVATAANGDATEANNATADDTATAASREGVQQ